MRRTIAAARCDSCGLTIDLDMRVKPRDPEASIRVAPGGRRFYTLRHKP